MLWVVVNYQYPATSYAEEPAPSASAVGKMSSANYVLSSSLGSVDSMAVSSSANYSLQSGFMTAANMTSSIPAIAVPAVTLLGLVVIGAVMFAILALRRRNTRRRLDALA
jgi:flagellar biosynthesis/type III secretory pathway M-ring protein FliF/YscJ